MNIKNTQYKVKEISLYRDGLAAKTLVIPVKINGHKLMGLIDSAAQVSVINNSLLKQLGPSVKLKEHVRLSGAGKESEMEARITSEVPVEIGKSKLKWKFVAADINDDIILGIDFLEYNHAVIDLSSFSVSLNSENIPATCLCTETVNNIKIYRIELKKKVVVPPYSIKLAETNISTVPDNNIIVQPRQHLKGLLSPNILIPEGEQVKVVLRNNTNQYITLKEGHKYGIGMEIDKIIEHQSDKSTESTDKTSVNPSFQNTCINGPDRYSVSPDDQNTCTSSNTSDQQSNTNDQQSFNINTLKIENFEKFEKLEKEIPTHLQDLFNRSIKDMNTQQRIKIAELLIKYATVFAKNDMDLGLYNGPIKHKIDTGDAQPIRQRLRRTPLKFENEEEKHLQQMLEKGVIQPSCSDWASAPVLVRKKDGSIRYCIDYRALNKVTTKDAFPLPRMETCIDTLRGCVYMSCVDMASGYWQLLVHPKDRHKTAFITKYGLFEHVRLPFGLCNSPASFNRVMQCILQGLTWSECLAYLDDVIILGKNFDDHLQNLSAVLDRFKTYNLKLKPSKCQLFQKEVKFLGKIVNENGISVNPESVEVIKSWPIPKTKKQLESFLGFTNYHREHIRNYSNIAAPLHRLTREKTEFDWNDTCQEAFSNLKSALIQATILGYPDPNETFILDTDASDGTIGAELSQIQNGIERTICFASKIMTATQRKYCTTRKELLAIVTFTRQFRHYLLGGQFLVRTDHNSLTWLLNFQNIEGQLARWIEELSQYDMIIQHRPGKKHGNADALSRIPDDLDLCNNYQPIIQLEDLPCGGCKFCTRARKQWKTFEEDVDFVMPLSVRKVSVHNTLKDNEIGSNWADSFSKDELVKSQNQDTDIKQLVNWLNDDYEPRKQELQMCSPQVRHLWNCKSQLQLKDGILYYLWEDPLQDRLLFIVPKGLRQQVLRYCHDLRSSGHLGQNKTISRLKKTVYWYGMSTDCGLYVSTCKTCNTQKKPCRKAKAQLGQYHAGVPFERIHIDILGPLPITTQGNKYILVIIDQFTKWLECCPLPCQNAETVAKALMDSTLSRFGCPLELHSDQGKNVDGNLIRQLCNLLEISKTRTTAYHPASNGQVERYNRLILQIIRCFLKKTQNKWDVHLQQLAGAIRSTENRQTGYTPNFLLFGREVSQPLDLLLGGKKYNEEDQVVAEYVIRLQNTLSSVHMLSRENLKMAQRRQKRDYDLNTNFRTYTVGDVVLKIDSAKKVGQSPKLRAPWKGPYIVVEEKSPVLYKIQDKKGTTVIHHDRLKLYRGNDFPVWLKRLRNSVIGKEVQETREEYDETDYLNLDWLYGQTEHMSEILTSDDRNTSDTLINNEGPITIQDLDFLDNISNDLDETFIYDLDPLPGNSHQLDQTRGRQKQIPRHLQNYVL